MRLINMKLAAKSTKAHHFYSDVLHHLRGEVSHFAKDVIELTLLSSNDTHFYHTRLMPSYIFNFRNSLYLETYIIFLL